MANRKQTLTKDHLNCPVCNYDYSTTNIVQRFERNGNTSQMIFICECKQKLVLRLMAYRWFKIYDITEQEIRKNKVAKEKRKLLKDAANN